jgi:hypothetical protein
MKLRTPQFFSRVVVSFDRQPIGLFGAFSSKI